MRAVVCIGALLAVLPATALELVSFKDGEFGQILLAQDCHPRPPDKRCERAETQVSSGDANRIERALRSNRFDEVWLNSGGGNSAEGPLIGEVLRRNGMAVRIKSGHSCASACTVAFLGGVIRTIEDKGQYLVHARSGFMSMSGDEAQETLARVLADPDGEIERFVLTQRRENRDFVRNRLMYLQRMLGGQPNATAYRSIMGDGLDKAPTYVNSAAFRADVARIRVEGRAAVHAVLLDLERQSFDEALAHARPHLDSFGPRAGAAHRMMAAMFSSLIVRTSLLSPETLVRLGFVTPQIGNKK